MSIFKNVLSNSQTLRQRFRNRWKTYLQAAQKGFHIMTYIQPLQYKVTSVVTSLPSVPCKKKCLINRIVFDILTTTCIFLWKSRSWFCGGVISVTRITASLDKWLTNGNTDINNKLKNCTITSTQKKPTCNHRIIKLQHK